MKIVAFLNAYSQGKSGADVIFVEIYKRMKGIDLTIITSELGKEFCIENGLDARFIVTTKEKSFGNIIYTYIKRLWISLKEIKKIKTADIVYSTSDALPDVLPAFILSKQLKKPLLGNIFHLIPVSRFISFLTQEISFQLYKLSKARCFVDNETLIKDLIRQDFEKEKLILRYPGINFTFIQNIKPVNEYDAVSMVRIHESKGIEDLIEIWKNVILEKPNATLGIIGTGSETYIDFLNEKIYENNLSTHIKLLGFLNDTEAFQLIKGSSVFVFASHEEGFGMAIGEALACNTRVIAYDLPAYRNTFKKFITAVPCFDKHTFANKIIEKLNTKKELRVSKKDLEKFSWESVLKLEKNIINL